MKDDVNCDLKISEQNDCTFLDTNKAACFLEVKAGTLQRWRVSGKYELPYCKIGGKVRYRLGDLRKFIANRMRTHT